jgi:hypothetical protein
MIGLWKHFGDLVSTQERSNNFSVRVLQAYAIVRDHHLGTSVIN